MARLLPLLQESPVKPRIGGRRVSRGLNSRTHEGLPRSDRPRKYIPLNANKTYPYLLGVLRIDRPNQVWCADVTYWLMRKDFIFLVAIMYWFSRKVLCCRISNTLEADFCLNALNKAIRKFYRPEIMNIDESSLCTSFGRTDRLKRHKTMISMDSKTRYLDITFMEQLWR